MKKVFLFCFILSLICPLTDIGQEKLEACTIGVASGKATADGRPLLWRNRDGWGRDYELAYFKNGRFKHLATAYPGYSQAIIGAAVNEFGFCIVEAGAFDLQDKSGRIHGIKNILSLALRQCVTVDDFESLLKQTNVLGRDTHENVGVIDAFGGAAIFEIGSSFYTRFDANNPKVAPQGYIIRANFALTGGGDSGRARYDRANLLWQQAIEKDQLDYRYVLRKVCRDLSGTEEISYTQPEMEITEDNAIKVLNNQNAISRPGTTNVALFHGVRPDENPSLTTFWVILGGPIFSVAVPSWVIAESTAPELDGDEFSPLCTAANDLYLANYVTDNKRKLLLNPKMLPDIWAVTYPAEDRIFDQTESIMAQWRQDYPTAQEVASFHRSMASEAMIALEEVTEKLIEKGGPTANLRIALHMRSKEKAKAFIKEGININVLDGHGYTPLHYAVQYNQKDIVELLLIKGADFNSADNEGNTSLHRAAQNGQRDIVGLLIDKGADLNAKNEKGQTPVDIALRRRRKEIVKLLIAKGVDVSIIHLAAYLGDVAKVMDFIEHGSDVNTKHQGGGTPLHYAAMAGSKEVSELLLARGADIKARNGATPLHWCSMKGHRDLAEFLITKGADIDARDDKWGETPLHWSANSGRKAVVELLIAKGADIHVKDKTGHTPLYWAVDKGHRDVAEVLIAKGADVDAKGNEGKTALSLAREKGHTEIVELLRKHGAKE